MEHGIGKGFPDVVKLVVFSDQTVDRDIRSRRLIGVDDRQLLIDAARPLGGRVDMIPVIGAENKNEFLLLCRVVKVLQFGQKAWGQKGKDATFVPGSLIAVTD